MNKIGILIGIFYGKGLILCPNNKLRYFDYDDDIYYFFRNMGWTMNCTDDKKKNVMVYGDIFEGCIAEYEDIPQEKYKVKILKRFKNAEELKSIDDSLYSYFQTENKKFNPQNEIDSIMYIANKTNLEEVLETYRVYLYETNECKTLCYTIETSNKYIHYLLSGIQKYNEEFINTKYKDAIVTRQTEIEEKYKETARSKYSLIDHIKYLMHHDFLSNLSSHEKRLNNRLEIDNKYPVYEIFYLIKKNWPHMKAELLCRKYNDIYDGYNYEIFGKKYSSRKEYLKRRQNSFYTKKFSHNMYSWDPESDVMDALMHGDPECFGF